MLKKKAPFDIKKWIKKELKDAHKESKKAGKARDKSDYTDIDALEQFCFNEGIIHVLSKLHGLLR